MLSEMYSSNPVPANHLGNIAMGASRADMDLAFRMFLSKSSEVAVFRIRIILMRIRIRIHGSASVMMDPDPDSDKDLDQR